MKMHRRLINIVIGIACIVISVVLLKDFVVKFAVVVAGLILFIIGLNLLMMRY